MENAVSYTHLGDAGLTGRKIIVDTYGGMARHGGGAFSGKDPSKAVSYTHLAIQPETVAHRLVQHDVDVDTVES